MIRDLGYLLPPVRERAAAFLALAHEAGHGLTVTETYRTPERQAALYAQGRTAPGRIVTNARPGQSLHEQRRAFDVAFPGPDPYSDDHPWHLLGVWAKAPGLEWGGDWRRPDRPHLQYVEATPTETRPTLRRGDMGLDVYEMQRLLDAAGFGAPQGSRSTFTETLERIVWRFQADHGLASDGVVGPLTWQALDQAAKEGGGKV